MKFNVSGKAFASQLQAVSKVINSKNTIQILECFLLRVEGDRLYITGSDSDNVMTAWVDIMDADGDGEVAISSKQLLEVTKEVSSQPLTVSVDEEQHTVTVSFLSGEFNFPGFSGDEYPRKKNESGEEVVAFSVPAEIVKKGLDNTIFAASTDPVRPIMTGICWDVTPDSLTMVSSDTHKLVKYSNSVAAPGVETCFILPPKPAAIIRGIITDEDTSISVEADAKGATFRFGAYEIRTKLINGKYPPYNRVIPKDNPFTMTVSREGLLQATRRVGIFASKASGLMKLAITAESVELTTQDLDYSTAARETVSCQYEGQDMSIGFKVDYMKEVLANLKGDDIIISLSDPSRPGLFLPSDNTAEEELVMLQMPMQVFG